MTKAFLILGMNIKKSYEITFPRPLFCDYSQWVIYVHASF